MTSFQLSDETKRLLERLYSPMHHDDPDDLVRELITLAGLEDEIKKFEESTEAESTGVKQTNQRPEGLTVELPTPDGGYVEIDKKNQALVLKAVAQFLIDEWDLLSEIEIPYKPSSRMNKRLISDSKSYPRPDRGDDEWTMRGSEELTDPRDESTLYIDTNMDQRTKISRIKDLLNEVDELGESSILWGDDWDVSH